MKERKVNKEREMQKTIRYLKSRVKNLNILVRELQNKAKEDMTIKVIFQDGNACSTEYLTTNKSIQEIEDRVKIAERNFDYEYRKNELLEFKYEQFNRLPWYKKMFYRFDI